MYPIIMQENRREKSPDLVLFSDRISVFGLEVVERALPLLISRISTLHLLSSALINECCWHKDSNKCKREEEINTLCAESGEENFKASVAFFRARRRSASIKLICESSLVSLADNLARADVVTGTLEPAVIIFKVL